MKSKYLLPLLIKIYCVTSRDHACYEIANIKTGKNYGIYTNMYSVEFY